MTFWALKIVVCVFYATKQFECIVAILAMIFIKRHLIPLSDWNGEPGFNLRSSVADMPAHLDRSSLIQVKHIERGERG